MVSILISILIFCTYTAVMIKLFGVPEAYSETYYLLEKKHLDYGWGFTAFCILTAAFLLPPWLIMTPESYQYTCFLSCAGLMFVGIASRFEESVTAEVHYGAAIISCIASQMWCIYAGYWYISTILIAGALIYLLLKDRRRWMFWLQLAAISATYLSILTAKVIEYFSE